MIAYVFVFHRLVSRNNNDMFAIASNGDPRQLIQSPCKGLARIN
jgi:hypothetical protein